MRLYILSLQGEVIYSPLSSLQGMSKANDEAIYNVEKRKFHNRILKEMQNYRLPRFHKWNLAMTQSPNPRDDAVADALVSRHCEAVRKHNEAIYNQAKSGIYNGIAKDNGEIQGYGLPRDSSESLAMTQNPHARIQRKEQRQ